MNEETDSLRKKNHLKTRKAIELAAISLVENNGLSGVSVDNISERAEVSRRTFFNYYDTKEDAILGFAKTDLLGCSYTVDPAAEEKEDVITFVLRVLLDTFEGSIASGDLKKRRAAVMRHYPQLIDRQIEIISKLRDSVSSTVHQYLNEQFPHKGTVQKDVSDVIMMLCYGAVRITVKDWLANSKKKPYKEIHSRATMLVREATKIIYE